MPLRVRRDASVDRQLGLAQDYAWLATATEKQGHLDVAAQNLEREARDLREGPRRRRAQRAGEVNPCWSPSRASAGSHSRAANAEATAVTSRARSRCAEALLRARSEQHALGRDVRHRAGHNADRLLQLGEVEATDAELPRIGELVHTLSRAMRRSASAQRGRRSIVMSCCRRDLRKRGAIASRLKTTPRSDRALSHASDMPCGRRAHRRYAGTKRNAPRRRAMLDAAEHRAEAAEAWQRVIDLLAGGSRGAVMPRLPPSTGVALTCASIRTRRASAGFGPAAHRLSPSRLRTACRTHTAAVERFAFRHRRGHTARVGSLNDSRTHRGEPCQRISQSRHSGQCNSDWSRRTRKALCQYGMEWHGNIDSTGDFDGTQRQGFR